MAHSSDCENEEHVDQLLNLAIEHQDAGRLEEAFRLHKLRMKNQPSLYKTDAVRLLGWDPDNSSVEPDTVESYSGIFQAEIKNQSNGCKSYHIPPGRSECDTNYNLGQDARNVFLRYGYCLGAGRQMLMPLLFGRDSATCQNNADRVFSGNSFFNHRHELLETLEQKQTPALQHDNQNTDGTRMSDSGVDVLLCLFLFGLAMEQSIVVKAVGQADLDTLTKSRLIQQSLGLEHDVVAQVQVYPLSPLDLFPDNDIGGFCREAPNPLDSDSVLLFVTDWPLESFRPSKNAVMPVGYDTLELCTLSLGDPLLPDQSATTRVLDLCCGCGVQGLFYMSWFQQKERQRRKNGIAGDTTTELVLVDINPRACHFAMASLALNSFLFSNHQNGNSNKSNAIHVLQGNLFDSIELQQSTNTSFLRILSNPPFVALPDDLDNGALYAGSGYHGLDAVKAIVGRCFDFLVDNGENDSCQPRLLMVTELPNVEQSCQFIQRFLPGPVRNNVQISIAYVENDVESVHTYLQERAKERGVAKNVNMARRQKWEDEMLQAGIHNRALVLLSIRRCSSGVSLGLYPYRAPIVSHSEGGDPADEEDAFLTSDGAKFARRVLLNNL